MCALASRDILWWEVGRVATDRCEGRSISEGAQRECGKGSGGIEVNLIMKETNISIP